MPTFRIPLACHLDGWGKGPGNASDFGRGWPVQSEVQEALGPRELSSGDRAQQRLTAIPLPCKPHAHPQKGSPISRSHSPGRNSRKR